MRTLLLLSAVALWGCGAPSGSLSAPAAPDVDPESRRPAVVEEQVTGEEPERPGASFFRRDRFLQIDIELPEASWEALTAAPYEYTPAHVVVDGRRVENVAVRLRGRIGSFRPVHQKPKWRIDFNRYAPGRRIDGLEALNLDNNVVDCSGLKQQLAFRVMEAAGTLGSRSGFAQVRVGGVDYGIYDAIEVQDDRLLADRFEDGSGNLYDGAYIWYGDRNYTLMDFTEAVEDQWELEEGVDVGRADIIAVREALDAGSTNDAFVETLRTVWDVDAFFRYAAVEHWVGQNDGYVLNTNNNRVYFDPTDGRGTFISYDLDYSFMPQPWGANWNNPRGRMAWHCVNDTECRAGIADAAADLLTTLEATPLLEEFDAWDEMTRIPAINDGNSGCSTAQIGSRRGVLRDWIVGRGDTLRNHWGLP